MLDVPSGLEEFKNQEKYSKFTKIYWIKISSVSFATNH